MMMMMMAGQTKKYLRSCAILLLWDTSLLVSFSVALDTKTKQTNKSVFSQAFEANASSSGGIQTLIDKHMSQGNKITTLYELQQ